MEILPCFTHNTQFFIDAQLSQSDDPAALGTQDGRYGASKLETIETLTSQADRCKRLPLSIVGGSESYASDSALCYNVDYLTEPFLYEALERCR